MGKGFRKAREKENFDFARRSVGSSNYDFSSNLDGFESFIYCVRIWMTVFIAIFPFQVVKFYSFPIPWEFSVLLGIFGVVFYWFRIILKSRD